MIKTHTEPKFTTAIKRKGRFMLKYAIMGVTSKINAKFKELAE